MTKEETNLELIKTNEYNTVIQVAALSQCLMYLTDSLDVDKMNSKMRRIFKDSLVVFKACNNHCKKKMGVLYEEFYKVDPNTIDNLIEEYQKIFNELKNLKIEEVVTIKE